MVHCVSQSCREELDENWSFCPYCGSDNRPPERQPKVKGCRHEFIGGKGFCVACGANLDDKFVAKPWLFKLGVGALGGGAFILVATFLVWKIHAQGSGPGHDWIASWYDQTYESYGRYGHASTKQRGQDIVTWMALLGIGMILLGASVFVRKAAPTNRYSDWD